MSRCDLMPIRFKVIVGCAANSLSTIQHSPPAGKPAFPLNYFHFCKSAFLAAKPLSPSLYKGFFPVNTPVFRPAFCTHGGQPFVQIHALIVPCILNH